MEIETERLRIRYFRESDLVQYAPIVADPEVMRFVGGPQTRNEAEAYLAEMINLSRQCGLGRYAVELKQDSRLIGFCGFRPADPYVDFGYRYARQAWGQGIGIEPAMAVREYGLDELGLRNMEAGAAKQNVASIKILEKLEFKYREELIFDGVPALRFRDARLQDEP